MDLIVPEGMIFIVILAAILIWVLAIRSIIINDFPTKNEKLIWALLVILVPFLGTIVYYLFGIWRKKKKLKNGIIQ